MTKKITTKTITISPQKLGIIINTIRDENEIIIEGIGLLKVKKIKGRKFMHNKGNKIVTTKTKNKLTFTPTLALKQYIQQCQTKI